MRLSIIIPTLNDAEALAALPSFTAELIVADGGSRDAVESVAEAMGARLVRSAPGRGVQMNAGAAEASGDVLLFLHADTLMPDNYPARIEQALAMGRQWGRFDLRLSGTKPMFRLIEQLINWRSRLTGIASGDQAIFVNSEAFSAVGGYEAIPLMEDLALCHALRKRFGRPACITTPVITSSRRWEQFGTWRTIFLMWRLRLSYYLGASPVALAERYRRG